MINIIELNESNVSEGMLDTFERRQVVSRRFNISNGVKSVEEINFVDDWSYEERRQIVRDYIMNAKEKSLYTTAVYIEDVLAGFMVLDCNPIGPLDAYCQLKELHVSQKHRKLGIGKALFNDAIKKAEALSFDKIYISAHSAYETQLFYEKQNCVDAEWLYPKAVESEPYDIQLEYVI